MSNQDDSKPPITQKQALAVAAAQCSAEIVAATVVSMWAKGADEHSLIAFHKGLMDATYNFLAAKQ